MTEREIELSLIFPCYNEQDSVDQVIPLALKVQEQSSEPIEILVVNDGSTDQSLKRLKAYESQVQIISHETNKGYGAALKTGLFYSKGKHIAFMDFDGTCDPLQSTVLLHYLKARGSDMVLGNRMHDESQMPTLRNIGNRLYTGVLKFLQGNQTPKDICSGFRVIQRDTAEALYENLPDDLSFTPAMTAKALRMGFSIEEHPIHYKERIGHSKISLLKDGPKFFFSILKGYMG
ncbi:MAG: hypothetical protein CL676_07475 [Bdellovibrionaceae bacterium]|nr:hypothetical protein [Pseudobdellovibrionaceae bacterium]|tara:strand:- start:2130 stop:2828 length:699 start_codon:yes stop_codon:yes gene_type:complete